MSANTYGYGYGYGLDELLEQHCTTYDSADYVRLAMAAATEAGASPEQLAGLRDCLEHRVSHTVILQPDAVTVELWEHDHYAGDPHTGADAGTCGFFGDDIERALRQCADDDLLHLAMAALDQAGMSRAGQGHVRAILGVAS